jgi:hypothetical protein
VAVAVSETLRTVIDAGNQARRLDELSTARVILKIAEQVHAAQQKAGAGKAIGPLTPSSISIDPTGSVKLGLAEPNAFAYAAPEQLGASEGDRRSDVWSLGVVMWEALTHTSLFEGGDDDAIKAAVRQQNIDPPATLNANIPHELSAICMRALSRNPSDRYQSAKVMAAELEAVLDDAGYGDTDEKVAQFLTTLGQPKREPKLSTPPMTVTPAQGMGVMETSGQKTEPMLTLPKGPGYSTAPGMVIPHGDAEPVHATATPIVVRSASGTKPPSILDQEPSPPPAAMTAASAGTLAPKDEPMAPTSLLKKPITVPPKIAAQNPNPATTMLGQAPITAAAASLAATPGANLASALANAGTAPKPFDSRQTLQSASVPMAPILPSSPPPSTLPPVTAAATAHGFASGDHQIPKPADAEVGRITEVANVLKSPPPADDGPTKVDAPRKREPTPATVVIAPVAVRLREPTPAPLGKKRAPTGNPDPAAVVALPGMKAGRESQEVLGNWGYNTDSHAAISENDEDIVAPSTNKKLLIYVFGGLFAAAAIVVVIAMAAGGSKDNTKPVAAAGSGSAEIAYGSGVVYGSATGDPTGGSAVVADGSGSADAVTAAGSAAGSGTGSGTGSAVGSDVVAANAGSAGSAVAVNTPPPPITNPTPPPPVAKPIEKPIEKPVAKPPEKIAAKQPEKKPPPPVQKPQPHPVAHDPAPKPHVAEAPGSKADAEAAYKQGIQQFARGDSSGALASLRVSLASNPGYAPTWRGLGLVFEKMGEKDQARAAYKRYLQLVPSAGDADQIRNRMERL